MQNFMHIPVLADEVINSLNIKPNGVYLDVTVGGGGHSSLIAAKLGKEGKLICLDKDNAALEASKLKLAKFNAVTTFYKCDFKDFANHIGADILFDGVLADLGVSSHQIDTAERGFSYRMDAPLDMRMDKTQNLTAEIVVNTYKEERLAQIILSLGEERFGRRIANAIVSSRPIKTTKQLVDIISGAVPGNYFKLFNKPPAMLTFQALRIEVNGELEKLDKFCEDIALRLKKGGRLSIITFHSLEDRIVKHAFKKLATDCICPPKCPMCICNHKAIVKLVNNKPIMAGENELKINSRSSSAKLRVVERL